MSEPTILTPANGPGYACDASIDTEAWLAAVTDREVTDELEFERAERELWDNDEEVLDAIRRHAEDKDYTERARDNVYNNENDFQSVFTWTIYTRGASSDWVWDDDCYIAVCIHAGGDVRGNYCGVRVFKVDNPGESGFIDWVMGWWADPSTIEDEDLRRKVEDGEFGIGYSSNPTCHLTDYMGTERGEWRDGAFHFEEGEDEEGNTLYSPIAWYPENRF